MNDLLDALPPTLLTLVAVLALGVLELRWLRRRSATTRATGTLGHNEQVKALATLLGRLAALAVVLGVLPALVGPVYGLGPAALREAPWWHFGLWFLALAGAAAALLALAWAALGQLRAEAG